MTDRSTVEVTHKVNSKQFNSQNNFYHSRMSTQKSGDVIIVYLLNCHMNWGKCEGFFVGIRIFACKISARDGKITIDTVIRYGG